MKEYKCAVVLSTCEGATVSSELTLTEDQLESLNTIAMALPDSPIDYGFTSLEVIQLPVPVPFDIDKWYYETSREKISVIIDSAYKDAYNIFKIKESEIQSHSINTYHWYNHCYSIYKMENIFIIVFQYMYGSSISVTYFITNKFVNEILNLIIEKEPSIDPNTSTIYVQFIMP